MKRNVNEWRKTSPPGPSPRRGGEKAASPFPRREGGWGVRSIDDSRDQEGVAQDEAGGLPGAGVDVLDAP